MIDLYTTLCTHGSGTSTGIGRGTLTEATETADQDRSATGLVASTLPVS